MTEVETLRRFSRAFTTMIGTLDESYLDSGRPLLPSRVLFELGDGPVAVADLRRQLDLDSGHLSRVLRSLEDEGLVALTPNPNDGRQRTAELTKRGRNEWGRLDQRSDDLAAGLLANLTETERSKLTTALITARRLLSAAHITFAVVDPESRAATETLGRYFAELAERLPEGFDVEAAHATDALGPFRPPDGAFVVMTSGATPVGCGALQGFDAHTAEVKRMWIHPKWRGLGLGQRLLAHLEDTAQQSGRTRIVLDTNATLVEAIAMYESAGYRQIPPYNNNPDAQHWFEKPLV